MKKIKYIILIILGVFTLNSCNDSDVFVDQIKGGTNIIEFDTYKKNLVGLADGSEYDMVLNVKISGPNVGSQSGDITVNVAAAASSTAVAGQHYRIETPTITLSSSGNYLGVIEITLVSAGNAPPPEGTPEFEEYEAPILNLEMTSASGSNVVATGKVSVLTLGYTPPNPYVGEYIAHTIYRHPDVGTYPDNINVEDDYTKNLTAITGTIVESWFAVWDDTPMTFKINSDGSISNFVVDLVAWGNPDEVITLGDPFDASKVSHFDPGTGKIFLYYNYCRSNGCRVFWEEYTPQF